MKTNQLFEKLWEHSRTLRRVGLVLVMCLTLGIGNVWATDRQHYVGVALSNPNNYTVKLNVNRSGWGWYTYGTSKAGLTYEGKKVYIANYQTNNDDNYIYDFQWQLYDGDKQKYSKNILNNTKSENYYDYYIYNYDGNAWYSQQVMNDSRTYFDATGWTGTDIRLVISHAQLQKYHTMYTVTGTKLYYTNDLSFWDNAMGVGVVSGGSSSRKGDQTAYWEWMTDISSKATEYTGLKNYSLNNNDDNKCYLIVNNGKDGETPDIYYESSNYLTYLNKTQTYNTVVKVGAGSYSSANSKATISISSYELTSQGGTTNRTPSISTSASSTTVSACRTATTRLQVGTVDGDYQFDGWYTAATGGSLVSNSTDYTYYPTSANTYYARFSQKAYTLTYYANGGTGSAPAAETIYSGNTITVKDNINLMTKSGKVFAGWATTVDKANAGTIDYAPGATFTAAGNVDLYAVWTDGAYLFQLLGSSTSSDINTTDFEIDADKVTTGYEVNGVNFSKTHAKFKNVASPAVIKGQNYSNKFWIYDATHKKTAIRIYAKNTSSTNYNLCYNLFLEGVTATSDVTVQVDANSSKMISVDASSSKGARLVVAAQNKAIVITQIVAAEMGEVLPKVGETDYELAFPGRAVNTAKINGNIEITPTTALEFGEDPNLQIKKDKYLKFTTAAVTQIQVTTANNQKIRISDSSSSEGGDLFGGSTATHNHTVAAGTWYLSGSTTTALQVSKIKFADAPTITYNANGGSSSMSTSKGVVSENGFTAPSGKTFVNWNDASGGGGTSYAPGDLAHSAVTLYAQWGYALTYDKNTTDAVTNMPTSPVGVKAGSTNLADEVPVRSGYIFVGWQVGGSGTIYQPGASYTMPSSATTLKAKWVAVDMYISDARKKTWSSEISSGTEITNSNIQGSISGGTVVCSNSSGTLGANSDKGIVFDGDGDQITVTVTGLNFAPGSVIAIGAKGRDNNSSHTCGFVVDGLAPTPATVTSSVSANDFRQVYIVTASDGIDGTSSFTLNRKSSTEKVYLYSLYVGGCEEPSCTAAPTVSAATTSTTTATTQVVNCEGISSLGTGDCSITSYGFVYGTSANPTTSDNVEEVGTTYTTTNTAFSKTIESLTPGTTYYVRPYATNGNGTAYGTETYFTTSTVTMTPTLTNVTHTSGATSGIGGSNYTAVFTANTGYSMPNPTVTIGGNAATIVTDYTWSVEGVVGTITIPANKINGNIAITLNSAKAAPSSVSIDGTWHPFPGETITLTATPIGGNGPKTYQWYKGEDAIDGATNATYTKASCAYEDAGDYWCTVTCAGTESTSSSVFQVKILRLYVNGSINGDPYGNVDFVKVDGTTATASISLGSGRTYGFNIADGCGHHYGNYGTMQYNNYGPWTTNVPSDCGLTTTNAGTYIFTINYSNLSSIKTSVTFPSCTDPGLAFASASKSVTLCDDAPTNALTNTHSVAVTYTSSDETVATVASDGTLTIKKAGTTTITASSLEQTVSAVTYCADNASYTLTVNASTAAGLAYGTATMEKNVGDANFTNTLTNSHSLDVTYESSNTSVATVAANGEVTIKAAGTTTMTAHSAQQKKSTTCYAAGSATYTLTVYPVYTVTYNAMGGTCGTESANTVAGEVTLPTPTHASYSFDGWYTTAGVKAGNAGAKYSPSGKITLYAKWSGSCAGGGGSGTTVSIFDGAVDETNAKSSDRYNPDHKEYYTNATTGFQYKTLGIKDELADVSTPTSYTNRGSYVKAIRMNGSGGSNYIELKMPTGYTAKLFVAYSGYSSTNQKFGVHTSTGTTPNGSNCDTWNATASDGTTVYTATIDLSANTTYYLSGGGSSCLFEEVKVTLTPAGATPCYTVTYDGNGATSGYTNDPVQYAKDAEPIVLDCGYEKTGYAFIGWAEGTTHRDAGTVDYQPGGHITSISDDVTLYAIWKQIKYFKGTSSSSWNTSGNWSPSGVPAITDPVVIQANVTVDTDEAKALSVDIESGNTLTIGAGMALIIEKTLTKAGSATAASDVIINSTRAAGVGALIIGGETGTNKATVNFATKVKRESGTGNWINQFIGSPFSDCTPYVDYALQIYKFCADNSGNRGYWHKLSSGDEMVEFYGYNVLYNDNNFLEVNWTGTLNKSDEVTVTGTNYQTDNLFANSWPAPIHISAFEAGDFTNFDPTIYIFNAGTPQQEGSMSSTGTATDPGTYVTIPINSGEWLTGTLSVIPAMQAFFVKATGASPTLKFDYSKLVYTPALTSVDITPTRAPRRSAEVAPEVIRLHVAGENGWAENTYVLGREDFTEGYDRGWDGRYMEGEDTNPQLYTPTTDGYMAVNCVPEIEGTVVGFRKGSSDNNYIFSFDYDGDEVWYLNDQKAQKSTQIMNGQTYAFVSEAGDNAARFVISATPINKIATGCESVGAEAAKVRKVIIDDKVYIIRGGQVFDVLGKTIKK